MSPSQYDITLLGQVCLSCARLGGILTIAYSPEGELCLAIQKNGETKTTKMLTNFSRMYETIEEAWNEIKVHGGIYRKGIKISSFPVNQLTDKLVNNGFFSKMEEECCI